MTGSMGKENTCSGPCLQEIHLQWGAHLMEQTRFFHSFHNYLLSVKGLRVRWQKKKKSGKEGEALYQSVIFSTFQHWQIIRMLPALSYLIRKRRPRNSTRRWGQRFISSSEFLKRDGLRIHQENRRVKSKIGNFC